MLSEIGLWIFWFTVFRRRRSRQLHNSTPEWHVWPQEILRRSYDIARHLVRNPSTQSKPENCILPNVLNRHRHVRSSIRWLRMDVREPLDPAHHKNDGFPFLHWLPRHFPGCHLLQVHLEKLGVLLLDPISDLILCCDQTVPSWRIPEIPLRNETIRSFTKSSDGHWSKEWQASSRSNFQLSILDWARASGGREQSWKDRHQRIRQDKAKCYEFDHLHNPEHLLQFHLLSNQLLHQVHTGRYLSQPDNQFRGGVSGEWAIIRHSCFAFADQEELFFLFRHLCHFVLFHLREHREIVDGHDTAYRSDGKIKRDHCFLCSLFQHASVLPIKLSWPRHGYPKHDRTNEHDSSTSGCRDVGTRPHGRKHSPMYLCFHQRLHAQESHPNKPKRNAKVQNNKRDSWILNTSMLYNTTMFVEEEHSRWHLKYTDYDKNLDNKQIQ